MTKVKASQNVVKVAPPIKEAIILLETLIPKRMRTKIPFSAHTIINRAPIFPLTVVSKITQVIKPTIVAT